MGKRTNVLAPERDRHSAPPTTRERVSLGSVANQRTIDLNADAGESFGPWRMGADEDLLPVLSSVNIACGFHAGDPVTMRRTVQLAHEHGVAIGAHPGYPDTVGFGRRDLAMCPDEVHAAVLYQLGALSAFLRPEGAQLHHVKPHGALHHRIALDADAADAVARAVHDADPDVPLVVLAGPAGRLMRAAAARFGVRTVGEGFPDRAYLADGELAPRSSAGAVLDDPERIAERALWMVLGGEVQAVDGSTVPLQVETVCVHGDGPVAARAARAIRAALQAVGIEVAAYA